MTDTTTETQPVSSWTAVLSSLPGLAFQAVSDRLKSKTGAFLALLMAFGAGAWAYDPHMRDWMERHNFVSERAPSVVPTTLSCPPIRLDPIQADMQRMFEGSDKRLLDLERRLALQIKDVREAIPSPSPFRTEVKPKP